MDVPLPGTIFVFPVGTFPDPLRIYVPMLNLSTILPGISVDIAKKRSKFAIQESDMSVECTRNYWMNAVCHCMIKMVLCYIVLSANCEIHFIYGVYFL